MLRMGRIGRSYPRFAGLEQMAGSSAPGVRRALRSSVLFGLLLLAGLAAWLLTR